MKRITLLLLTLIVMSCDKQKAKPISEVIQKVWLANIIKENSSVVFTKGNTANTRPGYSQFKLNISAGAASLTEFEGSTFTGQWELAAGDKKLILKNLSPQPTGTNGTIEFDISAISETQLSLNRTNTNQKTGSSITFYELIPQ